MPNAEQRAVLRRRAFLTAVLAGSTLGLTGCSIRLESDAPHIPGIKEAGPPADQPILRTLLTGVETSAGLAAADTSAWAAKLARMHRAQQSRLIAVMATQGMTPSPTAASSTSPSAGSSPTSTPVTLVASESAAAGNVGSIVGLTARNLPMAAAICVTHSAAEQVLGHPVAQTGAGVPKQAVIQAVLPTLRAAVYALEVIVAKTPPKSRKLATATLTPLEATRASWEAALGADVPPPSSGYALAVQPDTDAARRQLAQRVLADVAASCADQTTTTRTDLGSFLGVAALWADVTAQLWEWGAVPAPFPGLQS